MVGDGIVLCIQAASKDSKMGFHKISDSAQPRLQSAALGTNEILALA